MKTVTFLLAMLMTLSVSGQNYQSGSIKTKSEKVYTLSKKQNEDLKKAAISKVKRFQENCKLIGSKEIPYSDKTCTGGYIDVAMHDFLEGARIEITSLDGKTSSSKLVKRYLLNLSLLNYKEIHIESYNCAMVGNFVKDANMSRKTGKEWYVGEVTVYQSFNAVTHEGRILKDTVKRTMKVYALKNTIYSTSGVEEWWDIKLDDITAKSI